MAILRGGRRIGNMYIRIGIPRDKSLENVGQDPRLKRVQGGDTQSVMGRFMGYVAEGEGFSKPNRFMIDFILPKGIDVSTVDISNANGDELRNHIAPSIPFLEEIKGSPTAGQLQGTNVSRGIRSFFETIELPGRNIDSRAFETYGPKREIPYAHSFGGTITATFYADKYLRQRTFMEMWQKMIVNTLSNNMNFYDEYTGGLRIYQLGAFEGEGDRDRISYGVELSEVYPKTIAAVPFNAGPATDIQKVTVEFAYHKWHNLTNDQIGNYTTGDGFRVPTVKEGNQGLLGDLLSKLPPELRRAGRDAVQVIRRNLPLGRITGGRVFPPFL